MQLCCRGSVAGCCSSQISHRCAFQSKLAVQCTRVQTTVDELKCHVGRDIVVKTSKLRQRCLDISGRHLADWPVQVANKWHGKITIWYAILRAALRCCHSETQSTVIVSTEWLTRNWSVYQPLEPRQLKLCATPRPLSNANNFLSLTLCLCLLSDLFIVGS